MNPTVKDLAELAKEASKIDPIDWKGLQISEDHAYELMASNVLDQFSNLPETNRMIIALATITKLLVENFLLNVKINNNHKD